MKSNPQIAFREYNPQVNIPGYSALINNILSARGIKSLQDIDYNLKNLISFASINDINVAAKITAEAITKQKRIVIIGDYDADGATSCALCIIAIREMGNHNVQYIVPSRFSNGYGLSSELVEECYQQDTDLIITVDNGITSVNGVARANELGIPVVVTDHHLPGQELPKAAALVNPRLGAANELLNLAGVGVAFYLLLAVRAELRLCHWFQKQNIPEPNLANYLDLVALGTVADIAILDKNNRALVSQGLKRIQYNKCCYGITALLEVSKRSPSSIDSGDLGFALGPRLNAAGRLEDMALGIECLLADSYQKAIDIASKLHELNDERKAIEDDMKLEAMAILDDQIEAGLDANSKLSICLFQDDWHQGVIGILASRIKDHSHRPTVIFAKGEGGLLKGSARSINGIHIRDVFEAIDAENPGVIHKFGGHAMAAGLSLQSDQLDKFASALELQVNKVSSPEDFHNIIMVDAELNDSDFSIDVAQIIKDLGPWGHHFPQPIFYGKFTVLNANILKEKHLKMKLQTKGGLSVDAIAFNCIDSDWNGIPSQVELVYRLDINEFRGKRSLQLMVEQLLL